MVPILSKEQSIESLICKEGGFSNDSDDPGGATKYGITIRTLEEWRNGPTSVEDVKELTLEEAIQIYGTMFWDKNKLSDINIGVAHFLFDSIVQHGRKKPVVWVQRVVEAKQDGVIGPKTINAIQSADPYKIISRAGAQRDLFYENLSNYNKFGKGWKARLIRVIMESTLSLYAAEELGEFYVNPQY